MAEKEELGQKIRLLSARIIIIEAFQQDIIKLLCRISPECAKKFSERLDQLLETSNGKFPSPEEKEAFSHSLKKRVEFMNQLGDIEK